MNGVCKGGPWNGKQYLSDMDYINAYWPPPKPVYATIKNVPDIKIKTHRYTKQWLTYNGTEYYQWVWNITPCSLAGTQ